MQFESLWPFPSSPRLESLADHPMRTMVVFLPGPNPSSIVTFGHCRVRVVMALLMTRTTANVTATS
jgi:hypothetical protein